MPAEKLNSTNNSTEDTEEKSKNQTEAKTLPTVAPPGMSNWFVHIDPRTKKETKVKEFEGVIIHPMSASITEVDKFGLVTVTFRQKMKVQEASSISNKVLSISVIPHIGAMYPDKLGFNWECVDFTEENMQIKLTFENPLYVSYKESHMLIITIKDSSFFRREAFEDYLPVKYSMSRKIMSIMEENMATAILTGVTDKAKSALDVSFVFSLFTNVAFS